MFFTVAVFFVWRKTHSLWKHKFHKLCFLSLQQPHYSLNILSPPNYSFLLEIGGGGIKRNILISHNLAESLEKAVVWGCLFRHSHVNVYSLNSGLLAFTFYSLVPVLQSEECLSRVVCWSEGLAESVGYYPVPGPLHRDKWSLFLPSHAFWLMLNPFGLIILIAVPAIKTTDAFVQL